MICIYHLKEHADDASEAAQRVVMFFGIGEADRACLAREMLEEGGHYELVAFVDGDDLDHAWKVTNSIDTNWATSPPPGVTMPDELKRERRSSMVGDVFHTSAGMFVVSSFGFTPLPQGDGAVTIDGVVRA